MKRIISNLASLKLTVGLLVFILVVLAAGTILESVRGREAAWAVYGAWWFRALLVFFSVNLTASLIDRWPWSRARIGFVTTHVSMLVILAGAATTEVFKVEGRLALWEGQQARAFASPTPDGGMTEVPMGFGLRLDDFQIDVYPGTRRPAMFRSRVTIVDAATGEETPAVIEMNNELAHGGYRFFQSSYQMQNGREMSILSVSHDPGEAIVFIGYALLVLGMLIVLTTRIIQRVKGLPSPAPPGPGSRGVVGVTIRALVPVIALLGASAAVPVASAASTADQLRTLPVQHDGRVMPLDTQAREAVWKITGSSKWLGQDPVETFLRWTFSPQEAADVPLVAIGDRGLATALGMAGQKRATFNVLVGNQALRRLTTEGRMNAQRDLPLSPIQNAALDLEGRLVTLHEILTDQAIRALPTSDDPVAAWNVPNAINETDDLLALRDRLAADPPAIYPSASRMQREVLYNRVRPTRLAWLLLLPTAIAAGVSWRRPNRWLDRLASVGLLAGFAVMTWGLAMRWQAAGRIPASNMYESMLFMAWGVGLFAFIAAIGIRQRLVVFNAAAMSALVIMLTDVLPIDPFIHPMPPVLSGTPWLAIHVPIIMVSYALLALAAFVAHMRVGVEIFAGGRRDLAATMDDIHYWYVQIGSILLIAGILTGSIWAASSWGRYWGWDPKEVWSLIAFLAYMAILHGRLDKWLGPLGVATASVLAFGTILMTYLGVNYVLAAGLHSYGFGSSKIAVWLAAGGVAEVIFVTIGNIAARRRRTA